MGPMAESPRRPLAELGKKMDSGSILDRAELFSRAYDRWMVHDFDPFGVVVESSNSAVEATVRGRPTILFGTNSYLGLNFNPACIDAAIDATRTSGTGSTASRVASGTTRAHVDLEGAVAEFFGRRSAVVFSTGFMANLGVIGAISRNGDAIFLDTHCHASILDAARLSGAKIQYFHHNDPDDLARLFSESGVPGSRTLVVMEGVYSVWGDVADLKQLLAIAKQHGAVTIVDEAHGFGIYGRSGRGAAEFLGVEDQVDIIVGTFSKSAGVIGGFCVTDHEALRSLRIMSRTYLYTASLPPAVVAAAHQSLRLMTSEPHLRDTVWRNARALRAGLDELEIPVVGGNGPIGCIRLHDVKTGLAFWTDLLDRGIYMNLLVPPSTPDKSPVLRFSVSAAHTPQHIQTALKALAAACPILDAGAQCQSVVSV